jgi:hypothetical protein
VVAALGCDPARPVEAREISQASTLAAAPTGTLSVELRSPKDAPWISSTLGPSKPTLGIVVTNHGRATADVSNLHVYLEAVREGVSFRCANSVGPSPDLREPSSLAPGAAYEFERALDCSLPLTGEYSVRVSVSFGRGEYRSPRPVRAFTLAVHGPEKLEPRPIASIPGLWGAIGSSRVLVGDTGVGSGRIAVSIVNGSASEITLPPLRLALRVYRAGSRIACVDEPIKLNTPRKLPPGESHREPVSVSCLGLGVPGKYEVAARLQIDATGVENEIGRLRIEISNDPSERMPPLSR